MSLRKLEEKNQQKLRALQAIPENKLCFECGLMGTTNVNLFNYSFCCTRCSGLLRSFNHRIKSISASTFTTEEIRALENSGNSVNRDIWLNGFKDKVDSSDNTAVSEHIRLKYVTKKWFKGPSGANSLERNVTIQRFQPHGNLDNQGQSFFAPTSDSNSFQGQQSRSNGLPDLVSSAIPTTAPAHVKLASSSQNGLEFFSQISSASSAPAVTIGRTSHSQQQAPASSAKPQNTLDLFGNDNFSAPPVQRASNNVNDHFSNPTSIQNSNGFSAVSNLNSTQSPFVPQTTTNLQANFSAPSQGLNQLPSQTKPAASQQFQSFSLPNQQVQQNSFQPQSSPIAPPSNSFGALLTPTKPGNPTQQPHVAKVSTSSSDDDKYSAFKELSNDIAPVFVSPAGSSSVFLGSNQTSAFSSHNNSFSSQNIPFTQNGSFSGQNPFAAQPQQIPALSNPFQTSSMSQQSNPFNSYVPGSNPFASSIDAPRALPVNDSNNPFGVALSSQQQMQQQIPSQQQVPNMPGFQQQNQVNASSISAKDPFANLFSMK